MATFGLGFGAGAGAGLACAISVLGGAGGAVAAVTGFFSVKGLESQWPVAVAEAALAPIANRLNNSNFLMAPLLAAQ